MTAGDEDSLLTLEDLSLDESFLVTSDGSAVFSGEDHHLMVDSYQDGSLRVQTVIASPNTDHGIEFELSLDDDEIAKLESDGSIGFYRVFEEEGISLLTSTIDKPWAVDAAGNSIDTWFKLRDRHLTQIVKTDAETVYPVTADSFWIPAIITGIRIGIQVLVKVGPRIVKYAVAPASRVINALKGFSTLTFHAGANSVKLDKSAMKHILQRHHPHYWDGTAKRHRHSLIPKCLSRMLKMSFMVRYGTIHPRYGNWVQNQAPTVGVMTALRTL